MSVPSYWSHKKYPTRKYRGSYGRETQTGSRAFILIQHNCEKAKRPHHPLKKPHAIAFESHEAAKLNGWKKVK